MGERDNHIATVEPSTSMKSYSLLIMGGSNGNEDGSGGNSQSRWVPEQELLSPKLGFLVAAVLRCVSRENFQSSSVFRSEANI